MKVVDILNSYNLVQKITSLSVVGAEIFHVNYQHNLQKSKFIANFKWS